MSAVFEPQESQFAPVHLHPHAGDVGNRPGNRWLARLEPICIFLVFGLFYGILGYWLVVDQHVATFESLNRLSNAYLAWHNDPPKLAAIGFSMAPVQTIVLLPFAVISSMASSLVALPIMSAIAGGFSMVALNRLLERCDMTPLFRYPVLILTGLVPTVVFYAAGGGEAMISFYFLTVGLSGLIAWFRTVDTKFLITSGVGFAFAGMTDYGNIIWMVLAAAMVATVLARHGADDAEVEGALITYVSPAFYAIGLWCLINWLIVSSPFGWIGDNGMSTVNVATGSLPAHNPSIPHAFVECLRLAIDAAPIALVVIPALIVLAFVQRNELAAWLAAFGVLAVLQPGAEALIHANILDMQMTMSPPQLLVGIAGAAWIYQSLPGTRPLIGLALIFGMLITVIVVWFGINSYPNQDGESAFHAAIAHTGTKPTTSIGGRGIGVAYEKQMANYINANVTGTKTILTDNSQTFGVILVSKNAKVFQTRLENGGSGQWFQQVQKPPKAVKYFLIAYKDPPDVLSNTYQGAVNGTRQGLTVVYRNARYALIKLTPGTTAASSLQKRNVNIPDSVVPLSDIH